jgi:hypothetical protein
VAKVIQFPVQFTSQPFFEDMTHEEKLELLKVMRSMNANGVLDERIKKLEDELDEYIFEH